MRDAWKYARTRLLTGRVGLLCVGMTVLLLVAMREVTPGAFLGCTLLLAAMITVLRLWDDIADADHDRRRGVERVMAQTGRTAIPIVLLGIGIAVVSAFLVDEPPRFATFAVLLVALGLVYHAPVCRSIPRPMRVYLVLGKYPVLLYLAGAPLTVRGWIAATVAYVVIAAYDTWDEEDMRPLRLHPHGVGAGLAMLMIGALYLAGAR